MLSVSAQPIGPAVNFDLRRGSRLREFASFRQPWFVGLLCTALIATQALGFLMLGTGRWGRGLCESLLVLEVLGCLRLHLRSSSPRVRGITAFPAVNRRLLDAQDGATFSEVMCADSLPSPKNRAQHISASHDHQSTYAAT